MAEKSERAQREEKILQFWKENKIFEKSLEKDAPQGEFVFYDGPPFATGLPHAGSLLSSIVKDVVPRYKTMQGYHVRRRWGWDCHGLPIENMIEKELGIKDKTEIESKVGIEKFNETCRASVLRYAQEWKRYVDRIGRWVEYDNAYKTMDNSYIESVWHALKVIHEKGLLYEGRKVLLYCPHCQTPIAKAEVAMDNSYKDVTEESVYIKFKIKGFPDAYFLAWTTTPWTLPGNVALAVGQNIDYVEIRIDQEILVLAKERLFLISQPYEVIVEHKGSEMVGMEYEPLYVIPVAEEGDKKGWYVTEGDFVTTEEGTGIVHIAVLYGEDDYYLGTTLNLPMVQLLDAAGHFNDQAPILIRGQYFKKAEKTIKDDLESRGLLLRRENHTHSYPHCHRCGTALLYNAISSWFINIQKVKDRMIKLNEDINWVPAHLKNGRFLNIIENAPDWTISRNRYWAAPLPIWKDNNGRVFVIDSIDQLKKYTKTNGNKFIFVRHGEAESNLNNVVNSDLAKPYHLTDKGRQDVEKGARSINKADVIYTSPYLRTRESAEIIAQQLGFDQEDIIEDSRLVELDFGDFDNKSFTSYLDYEEQNILTYDTPLPSGESYQDAKKRFGAFLYDIDSRHQNKTVVVVTHGIGLETVMAIVEGADLKRSKEIIDSCSPVPGETFTFDFIPLPHNANFELDLHRPYIDEVELVAPDGQPLKRIPEVIDGWVESASMLFAEYHYPFENKHNFESHFPGQFVAEYIGQTRTWFYYMHVIATVLFDNVAYQNVVSTGNVLAQDGAKMSKSKGNYTDPLVLLDNVGADALRYYLMSSVVMQSEDLLFRDEEVKEVHNRLINILWNSFNFYELYADNTRASSHSQHILDKWVISCLNNLILEVTTAIESYDMARACRPIRAFVSDFSTWHVRRSRDRFKSDHQNNKKDALATTRYVLRELSKLIAPIMPFMAEEIYQKVKDSADPLSVHLTSWPQGGEIDKSVLGSMELVRRLSSLALEARSKANIKVRQPLSGLKIRSKGLDREFLDLIRDELNVKDVIVDNSLASEIELDLNLTPMLIEEGKVRDAIRIIQDKRKELGMKPSEKMKYDLPSGQEEFFRKHALEIMKVTNVEF